MLRCCHTLQRTLASRNFQDYIRNPCKARSKEPITVSTIDLNRNNNPEDIYCYRPTLPKIDTDKLFEIHGEGDKLRVKSNHISCLFSNLTAEAFDEIYNQFIQHLNVNFEPLPIGDKVYQLNEHEQEQLIESIITNWIYFYTINNLAVEVKRADFTHPYMVDCVLYILDKKYKKQGIDTIQSLELGAKILRQDIYQYSSTVKARRRYYER